MNSLVPTQYGGAGASYLDGVLMAEELAWGDAAIATTIGANGLATAPVLLGGSEELKREYVGRLAEAPLLAAYAVTEPGAGSDVAAIRTTATRHGDTYVISGSKQFITNGGHADWYTVFAKTDRDAGHRGISAFLVPRDETVIVDKHEDKMGIRASDTAAITFNETEVPAANLLGEENHGFKLAMMAFDRTRPGIAAVATGIARAAFEFASEYSKERIQFGVPIAMHEGVSFMIADMATAIEAARLLTWRSGAARRGKESDARVIPRKAVRRRCRDEGHHGRRPGLRRLRLHQGLPGREADARREDHAAVRGHLADPATGDRA
jgi:acyl-CoA dehydrogenase